MVTISLLVNAIKLCWEILVVVGAGGVCLSNHIQVIQREVPNARAYKCASEQITLNSKHTHMQAKRSAAAYAVADP